MPNERHDCCVARTSPTCIWLRDGTKVVIRRDPANGSACMDVVPQAILRPADTADGGACERCGKPKLSWQRFCGAACSARHEAGEPADKEMPARRNVYHDHLDVCEQCRNHPFALCAAGYRALQEAAFGADPETTTCPRCGLPNLLAGPFCGRASCRAEEPN